MRQNRKVTLVLFVSSYYFTSCLYAADTDEQLKFSAFIDTSYNYLQHI
jgi:hypothetical protein